MRMSIVIDSGDMTTVYIVMSPMLLGAFSQ